MHVVEITDSEAVVNVSNGCLSITVNEAEFGRVPLAELSVVLLSSPRAMCSVSAIASIAEQGGIRCRLRSVDEADGYGAAL